MNTYGISIKIMLGDMYTYTYNASTSHNVISGIYMYSRNNCSIYHAYLVTKK